MNSDEGIVVYRSQMERDADMFWYQLWQDHPGLVMLAMLAVVAVFAVVYWRTGK